LKDVFGVKKHLEEDFVVLEQTRQMHKHQVQLLGEDYGKVVFERWAQLKA